jgi:hypothetical protein
MAPARKLPALVFRVLPADPCSWGVLVLCAFGAFLRFLNAHGDLATPHRDENDVVVQAVAFMGPDHEYHLLEYGPLPMYLLAGVYRVVAWVRGLTPLRYAARVMFDYQEHYLIARLFCAACYLVLAWATHRVLAPRFGRVAAGISAILLSSPCIDVLTSSTVRIDIAQGAFQIGALLGLIVAMESGKVRHWVMAGLLAGCAIASKPLPGLLVLPCFMLAAWLAVAQAPGGRPQAGTGAPRWRRLAQRLRALVLHPGMWCAALAVLLAELLCNPTSRHLQRFITAQREAIALYGGESAPGRHENLIQAFAPLGHGFGAIALPCLLAALWRGDRRTKLIAAFVLIYSGAFLGKPIRHYYLVAPAMALCLVIGIGAAVSLERGRKSGRGTPQLWRLLEPLLALALIACVAVAPLLRLDEIRKEISNQTLAQEWILSHVPAGTRIFQFGTFNDGPRLVSMSDRQQARFGDYFEYGRTNYAFLREAFRIAYEGYVASGRPRYRLEVTSISPVLASEQKPAWLARSLDQHAREKQQEYIVLAGFSGATDPRELRYRWLRSVELAAQFEWIAIFHLLPLPSGSASAGAPKPAVQGAAVTVP